MFSFSSLIVLVCLAYALAADRIGERLRSRYDVVAWLERGMGALFIALGLRMALGHRG